MGRSVSYPSEARVITFRHHDFGDVPCDCSDDTSALSEEERAACEDCGGTGFVSIADFDDLVYDFRQHLEHLFPSTSMADEWIGREDHVLASNYNALFGMSEYCGLVSYWIAPFVEEGDPRYGLCCHWIDQVSDKFVKAFGELTKVGSMSNGEGVYRRIDKA